MRFGAYISYADLDAATTPEWPLPAWIARWYFTRVRYVGIDIWIEVVEDYRGQVSGRRGGVAHMPTS